MPYHKTRKDIKWGKYNLKKYLGISLPPYSGGGWSSNYDNWWGDWMDHYKLQRITEVDDGKTDEVNVVLVSEPYQIFPEDMIQIQELCKNHGLTYHLVGWADHNPGSCLRIEIWKEEVK